MVRDSERCAERPTLTEGLRDKLRTPLDPARRAGVLLRTDRRGCGQLLALDGARTRLGRSFEADARIDEAGVSRLHAEVSVEDGRYVITDLASRNGTYVGERRVERAVLEDGSIVRLGSRVTLRFSLVEEDEKLALSHLHELGHYDPLTEVHNRRFLSQHLAAELAFAERHHTSISVVLLDIDHFKRVNDAYGHLAGDRVLAAVAAVIRAQVRTEDVVARYGGEEFMIVSRQTPIAGAEALAERIRKAVAATVIDVPGHAPLQITLSAGCASLECAASMSGADMVHLADRRLYLAKARGRNRVVGSGPGLTSVPPPPSPASVSDSTAEEPPSRIKPVDGLARAFDALPPDLRAVVGLHFQERCSFAEIALLVDVSEATAREMFRAAMAQIDASAA